ncbi:hypothetical protein Tsubulata_047357 [Turnera subulata]|uniref:DUF4283 domain-containing protein n=1 Tax=Turnera subulata TaxID=218843 RepID=A0A9Q0FXP5_9ROSI|nr:hypothetical protein Tsubulata_047357 [Turnera subulata]
MASSSLVYDVAGVACEKSALVIDLGKMLLPNPNPSPSMKLKGKHVSASIPAPVTFTLEVLAAVDDPVVSHRGLAAASGSHPLASTTAVSSLPNLGNSGPHPRNSGLISDSSWAKVVSTGTHSTPQPLHFVEPIFADDKSTLCIPPALLDIGCKKYELCLVGQFMGTIPKMGLINAMLNKLWDRQGAISISHYKDEMLLIQFPNADALSRALLGGPWHVGGVPLVLRVWSSSLKKLDLSSANLPVWVQLNNVPLELLTQEGLSYIVSTIRKPIRADQDCSQLFKGDRANVYIEVDYSKPLRHELTVDIRGEQVVIDISYSWKPQCCDKCKEWGHHELACPKKVKTAKWVPKATSTTALSNAIATTAANNSISGASVLKVLKALILPALSVASSEPVAEISTVVSLLCPVVDISDSGLNSLASAPSSSDTLPDILVASPKRSRAAAAGVAALVFLFLLDFLDLHMIADGSGQILYGIFGGGISGILNL